MANENVTAPAFAFEFAGLCAQLDAWRDDPARYDELPADHAIGANFCCDIAPCTNNHLVCGRFDAVAELDVTIDYVFTVKMRPRPVQLRPLKNERSGRQYVAVKW
jgi:hypothetical protein